MLSLQQLQARAQDRRACSLSIKHALDIGSRKVAGYCTRIIFLRSQTVTFGPGDACRALSPAALAAGLPALLNEVRRMLLTMQPLQAQRAAAQLHELALEMQAAGTVATMRRALAVLQQQPEATADDGLNADIENENAMLLLQAWQELCCSAVACMISGCSGSERQDCGTP